LSHLPRAIIHGRNFVETLILSLTQYEMINPSIEVREFVTVKLEEELCALSYSIPMLANIYREVVSDILNDLYPDLPRPELRGCFIYEQLLEWLRAHYHHILGERGDFMPERDVERELRRIAIKVIRSAIMAALYKSSMVSTKA